MKVPTVKLGGVPISCLGVTDTVDLLEAWLREARPRRVATANADFLRLAQGNTELRAALSTCDLVTADGMPLVWISRLARCRIRERVAGVELVDHLLRVAATGGHSVYLLGGDEGSAADVARRYQGILPGLRIAGTSAPRVDLSDDASCRRIAAGVRASGADLLLLALGCPKQELFLERYLGDLGCRVAIGVGGSFEMLSARVRRAPRWLQRVGFEWLFRLAQEPRRLAGRYARDLVFLGGAAYRAAFGRA